MRLNKRIALSGLSSRRKADELIISGRIKVNGSVITTLGYEVLLNDQVFLDGKLLENPEKKYFLLNKPRGVISTTSDEKGRISVIDLLDRADQNLGIVPVGRLDYDTTGVLLLTNDKELINCLTHPSYEVEREYQARINGIISKEDISKLSKKAYLDENTFVVPLDVKLIEIDKETNTSLVSIVLKEGKNHEVKRIFSYLNYEVLKLTRTRFAFLTTEDTKKGEYRSLKPHEVKKLYGYKKQKNIQY
jgi:23S rRNA pseudouridine2605 synthase